MAGARGRARAAFAALLLVGSILGPGVGAVRAVDTPTTVTLLSLTDPAYRGTTVSYAAQVTPAGAQGVVYFDWTTDGTTWTGSASAVVQSDGSASAGEYMATDQPLGLRTVRAHFAGFPGWAESFSSNTIDQTVARQASSIDSFQAWASTPFVTVLVPGTPIRLSVGTTFTGDAIVFEEWNGSSWDPLPGAISTIVPGSYYANVGPLGEGSHQLRARFAGSDMFEPSEATITVPISKGATTVNSTVPAAVQANHAFHVDAVVGSGVGDVPQTGSLTITDTGTSTVLGTGSDGSFVGDVGPLSLGPHTLTIDYAGDSNWQPATSGPISVSVVPDAVEVTGVGVSFATFYPVHDGYRDTVAARGNRLETASVSIKVLNSAGHTVRTATIPAGSGAYSWSWNGKNRSSTLQPAGRYRIVQTLRDTSGTTLSVTSRVTLSLKRLHYLTKTYTKYGSAYSAKGQAGIGSVRTTGSRFPRGVVLRSGFASTSGGNGWAAVGYGWTLPAAVKYTSIAVKAYGLTAKRGGIAVLGAWNWGLCPSAAGTWYVDCFGRWREILYSTAWYSRTVSLISNRHGRTVRSAVYLPAGELGKADIGKMALTVRYAILR